MRRSRIAGKVQGDECFGILSLQSEGFFRNKVFATSAILTIGLGIGSSVVTFTVFSAVLLRPLPYSDPGRLVVIWETKQQLKADRVTVAAPNFEDWRAQNHVFQGMTLVEGGLYHLARPTGTVNITALRADGDFFHVLGMSAHVGRTLNMEDVRSNSDVLVLSDALWKKEFGGNADVIGQTTRLDNVTYTIAGVLPPDFYFPVAKHWDAVVPLRTNAQEQGDRQAHTYGVVARLRKRVSLRQAQAEMDTITRGLAVKYPTSNTGSDAKTGPPQRRGRRKCARGTHGYLGRSRTVASHSVFQRCDALVGKVSGAKEGDRYPHSHGCQSQKAAHTIVD